MSGIDTILEYYFISLFIIFFIWLFFFFKFLNHRKRYKRTRFSVYTFLIFILFLLIISYLSIIYNLTFYYLLSYIFSFIITIGFIQLVRKIKNECTIEEYKFFIFILLFILIILAYIVSFSLIYLQANPSENYGYLAREDTPNKPELLDFWNSILFSGYTFFSMELNNLISIGLLKALILLEIFISQMIIILFIGILASQLFEKLRLINK